MPTQMKTNMVRIGSAASVKCLNVCRRGAAVLGTVVRQVEQEIAKKEENWECEDGVEKGP
jgi:hypothetical protein